MALHKILPLHRSALARNVVPFKKNTCFANTRSLVEYTPPTCRITLTEKIILGLIVTVVPCVFPTWIIYHIPEYQGETRSKK